MPSSSPKIRALIDTQAVDRKRSADAVTYILIKRAAAKNTTGIHPIMCDVSRALEKGWVLGDRQAVELDVVSEVRVAHKRKPRLTDTERNLHRGIP